MPQILLLIHSQISLFLSRLFLIGSSLILLDQLSPAQAQITPNGAETVVNSQANQINITGGTQAGANLFYITNPSRVRVSDILSNILPFSNLAEIQNNLNQTTQNTGFRPALIYAFFAPHPSGIREKDTLEVILITEKREPLRVQFFDIDRRQVLAVANNLSDSSIYLAPQNNVVREANPTDIILINAMGESRSFQLTNANRLITRLTVSAGVDDPRFNLNAAQQMYRWLLAPLEQELQQQGIDNLVFVMAEELRSIPLGGLHDGQRFVRERYTIR